MTYQYVMGQLPFQCDAESVSRQTNSITHETCVVADIAYRSIDPPIILDCRFSEVTQCPYQPTSSLEQHWLQQKLTTLSMMYEGACQQFSRQTVKLTEAQLKSIQQNCPDNPNITLFIHGYNVDYGAFGKVIDTDSFAPTCHQVECIGVPEVAIQNLSHLQFQFLEQDATVLRETQCINRRFPQCKTQLQWQGDALNGEGAHNWWLHLEYNLNKAAGFSGFQYRFNPKNPRYTRCIHIAWSGNPDSPLDYMAVEPMAEITAKSLLPVIKQLQNARIKINAIGHSAGCIVLLKLLDFLAKAGHHEALNQVFLWQAAMPWNVLSPTANVQDISLTGFWQTQVAYQAARCIHVMFSHHDNVLGPVPMTDHGMDLQFKQKWQSQASGGDEALIALSLSILDDQLGVPNALKSAYHVAHLFHLPLTVLLFDEQVRKDVYQQWYRQQGYCLGKTSIRATLVQQVVQVQHELPSAFNDLAFFMSLYAAIQHDGLVSFLAYYQNDARLLGLMSHLTPSALAHAVKNIERSVQSQLPKEERYAIYQELIHLKYQHIARDCLKQFWQLYFQQSNPEWLLDRLHDITIFPLRWLLQEEEMLNMSQWRLLNTLYQADHSASASFVMRGKTLACCGAEMAALLMTIVNNGKTIPLPAMGYAGVDLQDSGLRSLVENGRVKLHNQTEFLMHHGAMRVTDFTDDVFKKGYQGIIMAAEGYRFGSY